MEPNERLLSLDTLRGFDMLFIMGFAGLITAICALWPNPMTDAIARQMGHVSWNGLTQHDTIFPLFLFIAGVSFPFSLSKQRASGISERRILFKVIRRGMTLIVLGMIYNGLFRFDFASLRVASVLGRIGLAWMFASLLYMYCKVRTRAVFAAVVLIGYSLLMYLVVAPDAPDGTDPLSVAGNIAGWVDRQWLPGTFACGSFDPEGLLSTLPAIVSALFGMFTGEFLLRKRSSLSGEQIALCMALAAVAITVIGIIWNCWIPINKKLWSSSFTCVVTGYSLGLFALFYYLIDVRGWRRWTLVYKWNYYSERYTTTSNDTSLRTGRLEPYYMSDLSLERSFALRWADLSLKGVVRNLFNVEYVTVLSRPMPRLNYEIFLDIRPKFHTRKR